MKQIRVDLTTNGSGAATGFGKSLAGIGTVYAVQLVDGTFDDGVDVTVTFENSDLSIPVLVKADFNTDQIVYPRVLQALNTDGTALTTHCEPLAFGRPKVVIAQGGDTKTGSVVLYIREGL